MRPAFCLMRWAGSWGSPDLARKQVLEMLEKGETPPGIRTDINDAPPDPTAPPPPPRMPPRPKPWERAGLAGTATNDTGKPAPLQLDSLLTLMPRQQDVYLPISRTWLIRIRSARLCLQLPALCMVSPPGQQEAGLKQHGTGGGFGPWFTTRRCICRRSYRSRRALSVHAHVDSARVPASLPRRAGPQQGGRPRLPAQRGGQRRQRWHGRLEAALCSAAIHAQGGIREGEPAAIDGLRGAHGAKRGRRCSRWGA